MKKYSFNDIIFKEKWQYKNNESGYSHKSGIIPDVLYYTSISGVGTYKDLEKGSSIIEQIYIDGNLKDKSFIRILDLGTYIKTSFQGRQEYLKIIKELNSKYNYHPKITYICNANPWITTTLKFARIFLNQNFVAVSSVEEAFKHINESPTLLNTSPITEDASITINKKEIDKIIELTGAAIWGIKDKKLEKYSIPQNSPLNQLFHAIKIMLEDKEEIIASEKLIAEERNKNLQQQKLLTEISLLFTRVEEFDEKITTALELIGKFTNAGSIYVFEDSENKKTLNNKYEWLNTGIESRKEELQKLTYENNTLWKELLIQKGIIYSTNIAELQNDLVNLLKLNEFSSISILPIYVKKKIFGFIQLNEYKKSEEHITVDIELLKTITNIISTAFEQRETQKTSKKNKNIFQAISNSANDGIILMDNLGNISYWNDAAEKIFGYTREEVLGKNLHELLTPHKYREQQNTAFSHFQKTGKGHALGKTLELEAIRKNGQIFSVELSLSPLRIDGKWHAVGMVRDITERKENEATIRENLKQIEAITANIPNIIWKSEVDDNGKLINTFISDKADDFLKVPLGTIGNSWEKYFEYVKPEYHELLNNQIENSILNINSLLSVDYEVIKGDGTHAWFSSKGNTQLENGKLTIIGSTIDITERKKIEKELKDANKLFREISENYPNSFILIIDENYTISFASGQTFKNKGIDPNTFINLTIDEIFENKAQFVKDRYQSAFNGKTTSFELKINNRYQYHKASSLFSEKGKTTKILVVVEDITERKEMENALRESKEQYSSLLNNLNDVVFEIDNNSKVLFVNKIAEKVFECSLETIYAAPYYVLYDMKSRKLLYKTYKKLLSEHSNNNQENLNIHLELTTVTGKTIFVKTTPILDVRNVIIGHRGIARDISDYKNAELKLKESEEKFRILFEKSDDALLVMDNGKFIDCNQSALKMLGYNKKEELLNIHPSQISPAKQPDGRFSYEKSNEMVNVALKKGAHHFEWIHLRSNGKEFPVDVWLTAIPYHGRKIIHVVWRDISERKQREREIEQYQNHLEDLVTKRTEDLIHYQRKLEDMVEERTIQFQQSEERYRILTENSDDVIMRFDKDIKYLYINSAIKKVINIKPEDFIGKTHKELKFPAELCEVWDTAIKNVFKTKRKNRIEFNLPNNTWLDWTLVPEFDDNGNVESVLGSARDITDYQLAKVALKENMERYVHLFNSSSDAIYVNHHRNTGENYFVEVNDVACKMLGYTKKELLKMTSFDISMINEKEYQELIKELQAKTKLFFETIHITKDGRKINVEIHAKLFMLNNIPTVISIARDITKRKKDEEELRRKTEELKMFNETMLNREIRMIELKEEVNKFAKLSGLTPPYETIWKNTENDNKNEK